MQHRLVPAIPLTVLLILLLAPLPALASPRATGLEPLVNEWRAELNLQPLQGDERLYAAAEEVAGDGTYCPQDRMFVEFAIGGAMYHSGYRDRRAYGMLLCGEYPTPQHVVDWIRENGGPLNPDLEDIGIIHLADLDFVRSNGHHVTDVWILLAADPMD